MPKHEVNGPPSEVESSSEWHGIPIVQGTQHGQAELQHRIEGVLQYRELFGCIRPPISADHDGRRFIVVGREIHYSSGWKTFPDFLIAYLRSVIGRDWWEQETSKVPADRHEIVRWFTHLCEYIKARHRIAGDLYSIVPDGIVTAYLQLAFDLYVLRHHHRLQESVLNRLKNADQFHGARYELFVSAILIRAGCNLEFEDDTDYSRKHPELIASHRDSSERVAVEAKTRSRSGVLGQPGSRGTSGEAKLGFHRKLNEATRKSTTLPLVIFVDLNLPAHSDDESQALAEQVIAEALRVAAEHGGAWPFALAIATNLPNHYASFGEMPGERFACVLNPATAAKPLNPSFVHALMDSIRQYGTIPIAFPET